MTVYFGKGHTQINLFCGKLIFRPPQKGLDLDSKWPIGKFVFIVWPRQVPWVIQASVFSSVNWEWGCVPDEAASWIYWNDGTWWRWLISLLPVCLDWYHMDLFHCNCPASKRKYWGFIGKWHPRAARVKERDSVAGTEHKHGRALTEQATASQGPLQGCGSHGTLP